MSEFEVLDPRFRKLIIGTAKLERLWTGARWVEGPAYFPAGRYLVFSDIPNDRIMRYDETSGAVSVFREPSGNANGNTVDLEGRLVSCEHRGRRIARTEHDGSIVALATQFEHKRLNSPNDIVVKSDGSVWFSDPFVREDAPIFTSDFSVRQPLKRRRERRRAAAHIAADRDRFISAAIGSVVTTGSGAVCAGRATRSRGNRGGCCAAAVTGGAERNSAEI
jgi:hypothetical protein